MVFDLLPKAGTLIGDKGHDADRPRAALLARGIAPGTAIVIAAIVAFRLWTMAGSGQWILSLIGFAH